MNIKIRLIRHETRRTDNGSFRINSSEPTGLMDNPRPATCTPADLLQWREGANLDITPKFQRRSVWSPQQKSYLIDTILREMPVPSIYLRNIYEAQTRKVIHQVIDGQQRISAVLDFIDDKFPLAKNMESDFAGRKFSSLPKKQQTAIMKFTFNYQAFDAISDTEVYEVFRRMNTYSSPLTKQELRHGRFFGYFSRSCESLAKDHLDFWRENRIISETTIARMGEVQFTSSLLIAQVDGMQNKNDAIDDFYEQYDSKFPGKAQFEKRFRQTIDTIVEVTGDKLVDTEFRRPALFYTLFCTVYHRMFGLPKIDIKTTKKSLTSDECEALATKLAYLSRVILAARSRLKQGVAAEEATKPETEARSLGYPLRLHGFVSACLSGTDNALPRETRLRTLYTEAFG
jgi:hypothetical protein